MKKWAVFYNVGVCVLVDAEDESAAIEEADKINLVADGVDVNYVDKDEVLEYDPEKGEVKNGTV